MRILALDLGTSTGYAVGVKPVAYGTWNFKPGRFEGGGVRFLRFRLKLEEMRCQYGVTHVAFEEVRRHAGTDAAHIYGGLLATLTSYCEEHCIPYTGFPVGTIKKFWTGNGAAKKEAMIAEAVRRGFKPKDDNAADAVAILHLAQREWALAIAAEETRLLGAMDDED